jgi:hypothetical protein
MQHHLMGLSPLRLRIVAALSALLVALAISLVTAAEKAAAAAPPSSTDVLFVFDTSGSMTGELEEAKEKINSLMAALAGTLPNVAFGVSRVEDTPNWEPPGSEPTEKELEENNEALAANPEKAWELRQPISTNQAASTEAVDKLTIGNGGDGPEAYARALYEADTNPNVGWRPGARHEIVLIADNVPHDPNLNEGIAEGKWVENPFNTGKEAPGKLGIAGTQWTPGTNTQIVPVAEKLKADGKPLEQVEFFDHFQNYLAYWEYWAGLSGGSALEGSNGELASRLTTLIEGGACGEKCPDLTTTQVICNLVIATGSDTCTATVADTSGAPKIPSGVVGFGSANGGSFSAGNNCTLVPTPSSPNTASCSVTFLPPTTPSSLPAITATYAGDAGHVGSAAKTTYPAADELGTHFKLASGGTVKGGFVEVIVECEFEECEFEEELFEGGEAEGASVSALAARKHKKKHRPVLLGKGRVKLAKAGKHVLLIKLNSAGKRRLGHLTSKGVRLTLKSTVRSHGTLVKTGKRSVKLRPFVKHKKHH